VARSFQVVTDGDEVTCVLQSDGVDPRGSTANHYRYDPDAAPPRFDLTKVIIVVGAVVALMFAWIFTNPTGTANKSAQGAPPATAGASASPSKKSGSATTETAGSKANYTPEVINGIPFNWTDPQGTVAPPGAVEPPTSITANCSTDVTSQLQTWFNSLPKASVVFSPPDSCYNISEGLTFMHPDGGLTIDGGTFVMQGWGRLSRIGLDVFGGKDVTFENLAIIGPALHHVYDKRVEFQGGIELQGTINPVINDVKIFDVRGDGITLVPERYIVVDGNLGGGGGMIRPVENLTVNNVTIDGTGRMGVSLSGVAGANITNILVKNVATDDFDFEADNATEGATDVTIDHCTVGGQGALFVSNQGLGDGQYTYDNTIENCTMHNRQDGMAVLVEDVAGSKDARGPFYFINDNLWCGNSSEVECVIMERADVSFTNCNFKFMWTPPEEVYWIQENSHISFTDDTASNYSQLGAVGGGSSVNIQGGSWESYRLLNKLKK
jgi:hypothetical protein